MRLRSGITTGQRISLAGCLMALCSSPVFADITLVADDLQRLPAGVQLGRGVRSIDQHGSAELRFNQEGVRIPLAEAMTADTGTLTVRFRLPGTWPLETRGTIFHVGEVPHVHVTLFVDRDRLIAVYKGGEPHYAAISWQTPDEWKPGSWHEALFSWQASGQDVTFFLEVDGRLVGRQTGRLIESWPEYGYLGARRLGTSWPGGIQRAVLSPRFRWPEELRPGRREIAVDGNGNAGTCYNFWSINNFTSQHMFADPGYGERIRRDKPFMQQVNCVRLLGGRHDGRNAWFKGFDQQGQPIFDFSEMIVYLRAIQAAGYTPRIVLDNIPTAMSEPGELATYGNTRPAKDLRLWHQYVRRAIAAMVEAFGEEEVKTWRFRVGTEPDLNPGHWQGTKQEYLRHYDCTVDAVCSILPDAEIGPGNILNPARSGDVNAPQQQRWGLDIVDHCAVGENTWTGGTGTKMCFLECSWYGRVGQPIDSFDTAVNRMRERLRRYPQFAELPISIAEFAVLQDEHGRRLYSGDITEWGASWYAAIADRVYELRVHQVHEWAQATAGILHPRAQVIGMLAQMEGGKRLPVSVQATSAARCGALACEKDGRFLILLYNHRPWRAPSIAEQVDLTLKAECLAQHDHWMVRQRWIDRDHGVFVYRFYEDCEAEGLAPLPDSPLFGGNVPLRFGPGARRVLAEHRPEYLQLAQPAESGPVELERAADDCLKMSFELPGHSVRLLVISPK